MKDQTAFSTRFARHKDELEWLFMELYHNREALHTLEAEMEQAWNRPWKRTTRSHWTTP